MAWHFSSAAAIGGRKAQQDRVAILHSPDGNSHLLLVADGMGGHHHGALAAQAVLDCAESSFGEDSGADPLRFLERLCAQAHARILALADGSERPPGSTCALLYLRYGEAYWSHVGDSRIYHWRGGELLHRTRDHTAAELLRYGGGGSAVPGVAGHELYMCLGGRHSLEPDFESSDVHGGDLFLLCSDGFWRYLDSEGLGSGLSAGIDSGTAAELVARAAASAGDGGDNISLALAYWEDAGSGGLLGRVKTWLGR